MSLKSVVVMLAAAGLVAAGCSSSSKAAGPTTTSAPAGAKTAANTLTAGAFTRPACVPKKTAPVVATPVAGSSSDYDIVSFDGTKIRAHWFPRAGAAGTKSPTVLKGPGWGSPGDTNTAGSGYGLFGDLSIHALNLAGYNVLTWDPRGFGQSSGTIETDSADFEGRDVERLIDWVAAQPGVQLDGPGDPRLGMVGASYGGGIQLVTAAIDCRVDAIVPQIAWHSLSLSLYEAHTVKQGWGDLLYYRGRRSLARPAHHQRAHRQATPPACSTPPTGSGSSTGARATWCATSTSRRSSSRGRSTRSSRSRRRSPTSGSCKVAGVPTAMLWMCSGHGVCLTNPGDAQLPGNDAIAWLDRYVKDDTQAKVVPRFEYVDQNGVEHTADKFPLPASDPIVANGTGSLTLVAGGRLRTGARDRQRRRAGSIALPITPARAAHAIDVAVTIATRGQHRRRADADPPLLGNDAGRRAPDRACSRSSSTTPPASCSAIRSRRSPSRSTARSTRPPCRSRWSRSRRRPSAKLTLQIVATTTSYAVPRLGGTFKADSIRLELPTVTGVTP